jgi:leader peptidase (prepilin peptidase) / N-methyltransferase
LSQSSETMFRRAAARLSSSLPLRCRRRSGALAATARMILSACGEGRPLAPTAWAALLTLMALPIQATEFEQFLVPSVALFAGLCVIALFDARYFVIPDGPIAFLVLVGAATAFGGSDEGAARIAAGITGFVALQLIGLIYEALRSTPGVGGGDARLFGVAGLWLGFAGLPACLVYAVLSALASAVVAARQGALDSARQPIPFGPHLALGLWLVWVFGPLEFG